MSEAGFGANRLRGQETIRRRKRIKAAFARRFVHGTIHYFQAILTGSLFRSHCSPLGKSNSPRVQ
jgi:hypothetical protein